MKRTDDFQERRAHLANLTDDQLEARFWELANKLVDPLLKMGYEYTSPAVERSVLLRMGFSSIEAKAIVDGCIEHNNRDFFTDNVDKSRTPNNITYVKRDLRELYHELFDEALVEYNARQNRPDRQIPDYYEHIRKSKK